MNRPQSNTQSTFYRTSNTTGDQDNGSDQEPEVDVQTTTGRTKRKRVSAGREKDSFLNKFAKFVRNHNTDWGSDLQTSVEWKKFVLLAH